MQPLTQTFPVFPQAHCRDLPTLHEHMSSFRTYKTNECPLSWAAAVGGSDTELSNRGMMDSKDESSHVWPTSADHEQNTAQVKDGVFQLTPGSSVLVCVCGDADS